MKKIFFIILITLICSSLFSKEYTIKDNHIELLIDVSNNNVILSQITHLKSNKSFLNSPDKSLWSVKVKKGNDYKGEEIILNPVDCEKVNIENNKSSFKGTWFNVKNSDMDMGFDVTLDVKIKDGNSYWDIDVIPHSNEYGIWSVTYPYISNISTEKEDKIALPIRGGTILQGINEKGFYHPFFEDNQNTDFLGYGFPVFMQFEAFTKDNSTLYICPEDRKATQKWIEHRVLKPYCVDYVPETFPLFMAKIGEEYHQSDKFNISVLEGDTYDACKKYRKWGIENKYGPFKNGALDKRKDIPDWWKKNVACMYYVGFENQCVDSLEKTMKFLDVPLMVHAYCYSKYEMDTYYPNWLPFNDHWLSDFEKLKNAGYNVILYTNGHLVDKNLSLYYKKYGDALVSKDNNNEMYHENWAVDKGAYNVVACPDSIYKDIYEEEICNIMKECPFDALYMDQVSANKPELCFNELHENHKGGGDHWARAYVENINNYRKKLNEIKKSPVVIVTEDSTDIYPFDGWLRVNENISRNIDTPLNVYVYSGYVNNFGDSYYPKEYTENDSISAINRTSATFSKGIMPGWNTGYAYEFERYPNFANHFKKMAKGREKAYEYLNLGEMVRPVRITSDIPKKNLYWKHYTAEGYKDFPLVRTCSFNYKGKTAVSFISSSSEQINVSWEIEAKGLNLKDKNHNIVEFYPNNNIYKNMGDNKLIKSEFILNPYETVILIVD